MNQQLIRRWHRRTGLLLAPFLLLQAASGLVLSYGVYSRVAQVLATDAPPPVRTAWNLLMAKAHFGPGTFGWIYHSLVGIGLIWMVVSGAWIGLDIWRNRKRDPTPS